MNDSDWAKASEHIRSELERLNECYKSLDEKVDKISIEIATLKVKSGVWGAIGGLIPFVIMLIIWVVLKK